MLIFMQGFGCPSWKLTNPTDNNDYSDDDAHEDTYHYHPLRRGREERLVRQHPRFHDTQEDAVASFNEVVPFWEDQFNRRRTQYVIDNDGGGAEPGEPPSLDYHHWLHQLPLAAAQPPPPHQSNNEPDLICLDSSDDSSSEYVLRFCCWCTAIPVTKVFSTRPTLPKVHGLPNTCTWMHLLVFSFPLKPQTATKRALFCRYQPR
jgi:hypothetical protein